MSKTSHLQGDIRTEIDMILDGFTDEVRRYLHDVSLQLARKYANEWNVPADTDLRPHADRLGIAIAFHWRQFAGDGATHSMQDVIDRLEEGRLAKQANDINLLLELTLAQAAGRRETTDYAYAAFLKALARTTTAATRLRSDFAIKNFAQYLIRPSSKGRSRIQGFSGFSTLDSWIGKRFYDRYLVDTHRAEAKGRGPSSEESPLVRLNEVSAEAFTVESADEKEVEETFEMYMQEITDIYVEILANLDPIELSIWKFIELDEIEQKTMAAQYAPKKDPSGKQNGAKARDVKFTRRSISEMQESVRRKVVSRIGKNEFLAQINAREHPKSWIPFKKGARHPIALKRLGSYGKDMLLAKLERLQHGSIPSTDAAPETTDQRVDQ